jgi:hypothetical protein
VVITSWSKRVGAVSALIAAIFVFDGDLPGENAAGVSTILEMIGISLTATSSVSLLHFNRKQGRLGSRTKTTPWDSSVFPQMS